MLPAASPPDVGGAETAQEDLALHARIDTLRDLFRAQNEPIPAELALLGLLEKEALERKPWARFRILTNLGSIALDLGREPEAVGRFEAAYAVLPDNAHGIANLALARLIQGRYDEAWDLAEKALAANPRSEYAISYLLQIAARLDWKGDPETLIPADLVGTLHADCPSSDDLSQFGCFQKGGSGSSVVEVQGHAGDAANEDLRWSGV